MSWIRANVRSTWWSATLFVLLMLFMLNGGDWGNPFSADVPVEQWFQHRVQWDPELVGGS